MRQWGLAAIVIVALAAGLRAGLHLVTSWAAGAVVPTVAWLVVPEAVPEGAPFAAWYSVLTEPEIGDRAWLQLRICSADNECVHGARRVLQAGSSQGLLTATRNLPRGQYEVSVLVLRADRFGVPRTVATFVKRVVYG